MRKEEEEKVMQDHRLCGGGKGRVGNREGSADTGQHRGSGLLRSRRRGWQKVEESCMLGRKDLRAT